MLETPLAIHVLQRALDDLGWNQGDLAKASGIHRSAVSMHLSNQRGVRDEHLLAYLGALNRPQRQHLLAGWLRDLLPDEILRDLIEPSGDLAGRLRPGVMEWSPECSPEFRRMLAWWGEQASRDNEMGALLRSLTRRAGGRLVIDADKELNHRVRP